MNYDEIFDIFKSSYVGKEINKEIILKQQLSNVEDKEIIDKFVNNTYIMYSIKVENINKEADETCPEIQILEIDVNDYRAIYDIYSILLTIIPYQILVIFKYNSRISLAVSKRKLSANRNNKGWRLISYLIREEDQDISKLLKVNIDNCITLQDIYQKWIFNVQHFSSRYIDIKEALQIIEIGLHIKSKEVLEKIEGYIVKYCFTYNMKPKDGWESKLEKYSDNSAYKLKVETHSLWEYLSENVFLKNKLKDFSDWNDFKDALSYSNSSNDIYYSQYNSRYNNFLEYEVEGKERNKDVEKSDLYEEKTLYNSTKYETKKIENEFNEITNTDNLNYDKENVLQTIKEKGSSCLQYVSDELKNDEDFMLKAIQIDTRCLKYIGNKLINNRKIAIKTIEYFHDFLKNISNEQKNDEKYMTETIELEKMCLKHVCEIMKTQVDVKLELLKGLKCKLNKFDTTLNTKKDLEILYSITKNVYLNIGKFENNTLNVVFSWLTNSIFENLSDELKEDRMLMLKAIEIDGRAINDISAKLKNDINFIQLALNILGNVSNYDINNITSNKNIMILIVSKVGTMLRYASDELKNDEDVVLEAVRENLTALQYASDGIKNNKEFMLRAIQERGSWCLQYASDELKNDKDFLLNIMNILNNTYIEYLTAILNNKITIDFKCRYGNCMQYASDELKNNKEFILQIIQDEKSLYLEYVSDELRNNKEFMLQVIKKDANLLEYASKELLENKEFMLQVMENLKKDFKNKNIRTETKKGFNLLLAIETGYWCLKYTSNEFKDRLKNDKELLMQFIDIDYNALSFASDELKSNKEFMLQAVNKNYNSLKYANDELLNDKKFILKVFKINNKSIEYASDALKNDEEYMNYLKNNFNSEDNKYYDEESEYEYKNKDNEYDEEDDEYENDTDKKTKKNLEINDTIYGIDNKIYVIKLINENQIVVKYQKKLYIIYNHGSDNKVVTKEEDLSFSFDDIGIQLFFKEGDCYKTANELLEDEDYSKYAKNIKNRIKDEKIKKKKRLEYIKSLRPNTVKITEEDLKSILSSYSDEDKSLKEELEFYDYAKERSKSYFARMDLDTKYEDEDYYEKFYISKNTRPIEIKDGISIIDWKSPLGDFFYDNEKKEMLRDVYKYKVLLKRKFMFEPFRFLNTYIADSNLFKEGVIDDFLMQTLLEKRNHDKATDIIYTIQSNQNKIIRTNYSENFIVQGCAGSGKTMILLHRLSYLKYNSYLPEYNKIKIITPGKIFNNFISDLSRDLDIQEIEQISIYNYYLELNNNYNEKYNLSENIGKTVNSLYEKDLERNYIIKSIRETIYKKKNKYKEYFKIDNFFDENKLKSDIIKSFYSIKFFNIIKNEYEKRIESIKKEISSTNIFNYTENISNSQYFEIFLIKSMELITKLLIEIQRLKWYKDSNSIKKCEKKIQKIRWLQDKILNNYYFSFDFYNEIIEDIHKIDSTIPKDKFMRFELLLMLYINYLHFGELLNGDRLLCFDEAQDYNALEYRVLKMVNNNAVFNLYGDVNQSIFSRSITDWNVLKKFVDFKVYNLNENFRNTKQISDFCNKEFKYNNLSIGIIGKKVEVIGKNEISNVIIKKINEKKKIVVIVRNFKNLKNIVKIDSEYVLYNTITQVKGIEFDSVIVIENDMTRNEKYIAYTRALNELYIIRNLPMEKN